MSNLNSHPTATVSFTWKQLEELLRELAESREQASMVPHLVSGLAKQYLFLDETMLLGEIMKMSACVSDPHFRRSSAASASSVREAGLSSSL